MKHFDIFKDESLGMKLDENERESMKESLLAYMEKNPVRETAFPRPNSQSNSKYNQKRLTQLFAFIIICLIISIGVVFVSKRINSANSSNLIQAEVQNTNK
jgi:hypothetical protein